MRPCSCLAGVRVLVFAQLQLPLSILAHPLIELRPTIVRRTAVIHLYNVVSYGLGQIAYCSRRGGLRILFGIFIYLGSSRRGRYSPAGVIRDAIRDPIRDLIRDEVVFTDRDVSRVESTYNSH